VVAAVAERYRAAGRVEKGRILDELTAVTRWHRKHAVRVLRAIRAPAQQRRPHRRRYSDAIRRFATRNAAVSSSSSEWTPKVERVVNGVREFAYQSFGHFDPNAPDHVGVKDARKAVTKWIADAKVAAKSGGTTLKEAWVRYKARHEAKGRQASTIDWYRKYLEDGRLKNWLDRQLASITPEKAAALHACITRDHGPYQANWAMRTLRAICTCAKFKVDRSLPKEDVTVLVEWNAEKRRDTGMGLVRLAAWGAQLALLDNPVRREFHLFCLLSGSRPEALSKAEWSHVNVAKRALHIPASKGGEERAFDIPLSTPMLYCLVRARRAGRILHRDQAHRFVFPALSQPGHLTAWRKDREDLSKWGADLRHSFKTMSVECGVGKARSENPHEPQGRPRCARRLHHDAGAARAPARLPDADKRRDHGAA
jgi:hypothetical protein